MKVYILALRNITYFLKKISCLITDFTHNLSIGYIYAVIKLFRERWVEGYSAVVLSSKRSCLSKENILKVVLVFSLFKAAKLPIIQIPFEPLIYTMMTIYLFF